MYLTILSDYTVILLDTIFSEIKAFVAEKFSNLHDHDRNVVNVSLNAIVCQSRVTVHYVIDKRLIKLDCEYIT